MNLFEADKSISANDVKSYNNIKNARSSNYLMVQARLILHREQQETLWEAAQTKRAKENREGAQTVNRIMSKTRTEIVSRLKFPSSERSSRMQIIEQELTEKICDSVLPMSACVSKNDSNKTNDILF